MANNSPPPATTLLSTSTTEWTFTRPDPPPPPPGSSSSCCNSNSSQTYFRTDMRRIAAWTDEKPNWNLPWSDHMYLAYPSLDKPDWPALVAHVRHLNREAEERGGGNETRYKIVYVVRRAHKPSGDTTTPDPSIDSTGVTECATLKKNFTRAIEHVGIPHPEAIVTSPLARALETAHLGVMPLLAPSSVFPITVLEGFREKVDGKPKNERHDQLWIRQHFPNFRVENVEARDSLADRYAGSEQEEPYESLWERVRGSFGYVFDMFPDALVVALVSHCRVIQTIQREITGFDLKEEDRKDQVEFFVGDAGAYAIVVKGERVSSSSCDEM